jgi:adenylylsulfate kinase
MTNIIPQDVSTTGCARALQKGQRPCVIWLTGLSGSGKSTLADALEKELIGKGRHTYLLDGDNVRLGLCKDLGFSDKDREENIRRVSEVARLFVDAGLIVITSFISPFQKDRELAKKVIGEDYFIEVYISTPIEECERRDPKGLYKKARSGLIKCFTGIDSPYEPPTAANLVIDTVQNSLQHGVEQVIKHLSETDDLSCDSSL